MRSKTKPWQTLVSRILDNTEVHIVPTINPDGWDRAEEGLCSGQVQGVPCLMLLCHVPIFSILYFLCVWMSPLAMCLMSCFLKPWIFFFAVAKNYMIVILLWKMFQKMFQMVVILLLRTSTVDDWTKIKSIWTGYLQYFSSFRYCRLDHLKEYFFVLVIFSIIWSTYDHMIGF